MDIRKLQRTIVDALEDVKAHDIVVFNTEALSPLFERIVIATGNSNRQTKALAASVREAVRAGGETTVRVEGEDNGEWIIVDCGAAVCHVMQPAIRDYYRLDEIWGGKPVRMKLGSEAKLPKASEPEPAAASRSARKPAAKPAARKTASAKPVTTTKVVSARKTAAKAAPAKTAARKTATAKTASAKRPAFKTAAAKQPVARRAGAAPRAQKVVVHSPRSPSAAKPAARPAAKKKSAR